MKTVDSAEIVVIGAGVVGCSIAYWLAKRGKDVVVVDRFGPGAGTSTANFGLIAVHVKEPCSYMEFSLQSSALWPKMVEELGENVDLRLGLGLLAPCLTEEDYAKRAAVIERHRSSALFEGRMLSPQEVFEIQPGITRRILGASWSPHDGDCDPVKWVYALARGAKRRGAKFLMETRVIGFDLSEGNRVKGVLTDRGRIEANYVVNAAGPWSTELADMIGVRLGLFPQRGQILVTEAAPMNCPVPMMTVRQIPNGQYHIGATAENAGMDYGTTSEAAQRLCQDAIDLVPSIRHLSVIRHFSGIRSMPRDGLPFIGAVPHVPGYYVAVGHSGITLSPIYGKVVSDLIVDGRTEIPIGDYDPLRYDEKGTRRGGPNATGH